jgi:hypothetical protein
MCGTRDTVLQKSPGGPYIVDPHGLNLLTAPGLPGGHIQRNHNGICSTISNGLREAQIPHRGGGTDRSCNGVFRGTCPAMTDEDARKVMNGIIPDLIIQTGHHSPDENFLAGSGRHKDAEREQTPLPQDINGFRLRSTTKTN